MNHRSKTFHSLKFKLYSTMWPPLVLKDRVHMKLGENSGGDLGQGNWKGGNGMRI